MSHQARHWRAVAVGDHPESLVDVLNRTGLPVTGRSAVSLTPEELGDGLAGARWLLRDEECVGYFRTYMHSSDACQNIDLDIEMVEHCDTDAWQTAFNLIIDLIQAERPFSKLSLHAEIRPSDEVDHETPALRSLGFVDEGFLRDYLFRDGERISVRQFSYFRLG